MIAVVIRIFEKRKSLTNFSSLSLLRFWKATLEGEPSGRERFRRRNSCIQSLIIKR
jgi:hypothetical protein